MKKKKVYDDDDGRVFANMNVEGMPWYTPPSAVQPQSEKETGSEKQGQEPVRLTKKESRALLGGVLGASLLVLLVFVVGFLLFIQFCTEVWFR